MRILHVDATDDGSLTVILPSYSLLLPSGGGAMLIRDGDAYLLPLFTDRDNLDSFLEKEPDLRVKYRPIELNNHAAWYHFLLYPPRTYAERRMGGCGWEGTPPIDAIIVDPIDLGRRPSTFLRSRDEVRRIWPTFPGESRR